MQFYARFQDEVVWLRETVRDLRSFALNGLTRRLAIIGVPIESVASA